VLEANEDIPLFAGSNMTLPQKQAMLFLTLFAAQDNTATLLTAMVAHLNNLDLDQRRDLIQAAEQHVRQSNRTPFQYPQIIKKYLEDVLKLYPPVPLVARGAKEDLCIDFKLEGDDQQYTKFIPKGSNIAARMIDVGDRFFGEQGPHTCPGKDLAKVEVLEFFVQLLGNYYTGMPVNQDYHIETQITGVLKPDVKLKIWDKKR
jgi:cytochrome P450